MRILYSAAATLLIAVSLSLGLGFRASAAVDCGPYQGTPDMAKCQACDGTGAVSYNPADGCSDSTGNTRDKVGSIAEDVINFFSFVVGIIAVIMIIIGGFKYIISSGDSNNISSAKNTILYAIIGLVIVAFAQIIVRFVLSRI